MCAWSTFPTVLIKLWADWHREWQRRTRCSSPISRTCLPSPIDSCSARCNRNGLSDRCTKHNN